MISGINSWKANVCLDGIENLADLDDCIFNEAVNVRAFYGNDHITLILSRKKSNG